MKKDGLYEKVKKGLKERHTQENREVLQEGEERDAISVISQCLF